MSFFDPIGWRYYLPAYMTWWLSGGETDGDIAADSLSFTLKLSDDPKLRDYALSRYTILSERQARVVARFLRFVERFAEYDVNSEGTRAGLAKYWAERSQ